jgi:hypothetical protein
MVDELGKVYKIFLEERFCIWLSRLLQVVEVMYLGGIS